jgi:hypothetical protein
MGTSLLGTPLVPFASSTGKTRESGREHHDEETRLLVHAPGTLARLYARCDGGDCERGERPAAEQPRGLARPI